MQIVHTLAELRAAQAAHREWTLVPTMGNLHAGHLALVRHARGLGGPVVASIFVNRLQFGPNEDFDRYPRTLERDSEQLAAEGCDLLFAPDEAEMYPQPQTFHVQPDPAVATILEGAYRPGHFEGVATVVMKLFQMTRAARAVFGKKDYQQLMIIRRMAQQFAVPVRIEGMDTVRADDGLALSSRNGYLSTTERAEAPALQTTLRDLSVRARAAAGPDAVQVLEAEAIETLKARGWAPDYLAVRRRSDLLDPTAEDLRGGVPLVALAAARLGTTRLIDNLEF